MKNSYIKYAVSLSIVLNFSLHAASQKLPVKGNGKWYSYSLGSFLEMSINKDTVFRRWIKYKSSTVEAADTAIIFASYNYKKRLYLIYIKPPVRSGHNLFYYLAIKTNTDTNTIHIAFTDLMQHGAQCVDNDKCIKTMKSMIRMKGVNDREIPYFDLYRKNAADSLLLLRDFRNITMEDGPRFVDTLIKARLNQYTSCSKDCVERNDQYFGLDYRTRALLNAGYSPDITISEFQSVFGRLMKDETLKAKYEAFLKSLK